MEQEVSTRMHHASALVTPLVIATCSCWRRSVTGGRRGGARRITNTMVRKVLNNSFFLKVTPSSLIILRRPSRRCGHLYYPVRYNNQLYCSWIAWIAFITHRKVLCYVGFCTPRCPLTEAKTEGQTNLKTEIKNKSMALRSLVNTAESLLDRRGSVEMSGYCKM